MTILDATQTIEPAKINYTSSLRYEAWLARGSDPFNCRTVCQHCDEFVCEGGVLAGTQAFKEHLREAHPEVLDARKRRPKSAAQREREDRSEALAAAVAELKEEGRTTATSREIADRMNHSTRRAGTTSASSVGMMMRRRGYRDTGRGRDSRAWILPD